MSSLGFSMPVMGVVAHIDGELTPDAVRKIASICHHTHPILTARDEEECTTFLDLFRKLKELNLIQPGNLKVMEDLLFNVGRLDFRDNLHKAAKNVPENTTTPQQQPSNAVSLDVVMASMADTMASMTYFMEDLGLYSGGPSFARHRRMSHFDIRNTEQRFPTNLQEQVSSFVEDVKAAWKLIRLTGGEAVYFILSHLTGAPYQEIKHQPLMREICNRLQNADETVAEYAFALISLADQLSNIPGAPDAEQVIKKQFGDGLLDGILRQKVTRLMKEEPDALFINVKDWALEKAEEDFDIPRQNHRKKAGIHSTEVPETQIISALDNLSVAFQSVAKILESIQAQQVDITSRMQKLEKAQE